MALIYSRPRIQLPKFYMFRGKNPKNRKNKNRFNFFVSLIMIIVLTCVFIIKAIEPVFNQLCSDEAKSVATIICNQQTTKCIQNYNYSDFMMIHTDKNNNITMIEANMVNINIVISDIAEKIQLEINKFQGGDIYISSGSFTGISFLAGKGPKIPIKISTIGNIQTDLKSEFIEKGVNQTLHRLYLEIECEVNVLTPFNTINEKINNQLLVAENIIVGNIPSTYYNLEGLNKEDTLDVVE